MLTRYIIVNILIVIFVLGLTVLVAFCGPAIETLLSPVIRFGPVTKIDREAHNEVHSTGRICFTMQMTKLHDALPLPYHFWVNTAFSPKDGFPLDPHLANSDNTRATVQKYDPHPAGSTWVRRYCSELPGAVSDADDFIVTGLAYHRRHPFWVTETPTPPFAVGAARS